MKTQKIILFFFTTFLLFMWSCSKDETSENQENTITSEEAVINAKIDIANDDILDIVEKLESDTYSNPLGRITENTTTTFTLCNPIITRIPAFGTPISPGTQVTKTIDFGTTTCELQNGNNVSGKIIISFIFQPTSTTHTITYTLDNFYHNSIKFVGTKTFIRELGTSVQNPTIHPIITMNLDMEITLTNGAIINRVGQRVREIIEGQNTPTLLDNIYEITGSWTTTFPNTTTQTSTITSPLRIRMSCLSANKPLLVKGIITMVRNNNIATLDYGDGVCDNEALFTLNGVSSTIIIGN